MKTILITLILSTTALADWAAPNGSAGYWKQKTCEQVEATPCYERKGDASTLSIKDVEVDDMDKPIKEVSKPTLIRNKENGLDELRCEAPSELVKDKCVTITGYEKKNIKKFVKDEAKETALLAKKQEQETKKQSCEQFSALLSDSAIDNKSNDQDVKEVVRRLLGYWKACR